MWGFHNLQLNIIPVLTFSQLKVAKHAKVGRILQGQTTHREGAGRVGAAGGGGLGAGGWTAAAGA
jgi:hypothetical protein